MKQSVVGMTIDELIDYHAKQRDYSKSKYLQWVCIRVNAKKSNYCLYAENRIKEYRRYILHREAIRLLEMIKWKT